MRISLIEIELFFYRGCYRRHDNINLVLFHLENHSMVDTALLAIGLWDGKFYLEVLFSGWIKMKIKDWKNR